MFQLFVLKCALQNFLFNGAFPLICDSDTVYNIDPYAGESPDFMRLSGTFCL